MAESAENRAARERGEARAAAEVAQGIADLRAAVAKAPEWERAEAFNGHRYVTAKRASLQGMLDHILAHH